MWACYKLIPNYGIALILFTIITRIILFPLSLKQHRSSIKMAYMKPRIDELSKMYKTNREKLAEEQSKLFAEEKYKPSAGCLPLLIQFPVLFGLIDVIYKPLRHLLRMSNATVDHAAKIAMIVLGLDKMGRTPQITVINAVRTDPAAFAGMADSFASKVLALNLSFMGLDLTEIPTWGFNTTIIIPLLAGLSNLLLTIYSMSKNPEAAGTGSTKIMMYTMPLISVVFAMQVPSGVGLYWIFSSLVMFIQNVILNKILDPKVEIAKMEKERQERRKEERKARLESRKLAQAGQNGKYGESMSQKEINRRKLAESRRREAERYGETYYEEDDL